MKKVLVDINSVTPLINGQKVSGIARTTYDLVEALSDLSGVLRFELNLYSQNYRGIDSSSFNSCFKSAHLNLPNRSRINQILSKISVKDFLFKHDLLHIPHNFEFVSNPDKTVLTIHDALFYSYPEDFLGHSFARKNYPELARNCKGIVTCSKSSKSDIIQFMGVPEEKITVIPWGVNEKIFFRSDENKTTENLRQIGLYKPFFLMVSCDIGRKNTLNVMRAYSKFSNNNVSHMLVLVWSNPPQAYLNEFADEIANGRIVFLSGIDDQLLQNLYSGATVSFFPSRYEGFGLPILESMACGTPVVTCSNSSLKEVGGEAAIYVDPDGIDEMAELMSEFERGSLNRDDLVQKSIANAANFTWKKTATQYLDFYSENLNS